MKQSKRNFLLAMLLFSAVTAWPQLTEQSSYYANQGRGRGWLLQPAGQDALYKVITEEAFRQLDRRERQLERLTTAAGLMARRDSLRVLFRESLGKFEKTPLNPHVTGTFTHHGVTVEKIVFESQPGYWVTACLFIPGNLREPAPAVIYCSGHNATGFRSPVYLHVIHNLAVKGFIVLAFDPAGQGERLLYGGQEPGKSSLGGPTREHSYAGAQTLLTGTSLSDYFIWDGIRAVDYLSTRKEVDMERIGITGRSGGGTQAAMIAACDDRILAVAPEGYITSFRRLLQSIGPQDAEQNPFHMVARGMDHADFFHIRAPKPALILTTTNDFFSQQGARETFAELQKAYSILGFPGNISMTEDMGGHESTRKNREAMYAFFQHHLNLPGNAADLDLPAIDPADLQVTPTGQVATSFGGETVFSLNRKFAAKAVKPGRMVSDVPESQAGLDNPGSTSGEILSGEDLRRKALELSGARFALRLKSAVFTGRFMSGSASADRYFLESSTGDYALPLYVISGEEAGNGKLMVWLCDAGKEAFLGDPRLGALLSEGYTVVAADLPGVGELRNPGFSGDGEVDGVQLNYLFGASLTGQSVPGIRAEAFDLLVQFIRQESRFEGLAPEVTAGGNMLLPVVLSLLNDNPFSRLHLSGDPFSAKKLLNEEFYNPKEAFSIIPGSILFFDTVDLLKLVDSGKR